MNGVVLQEYVLDKERMTIGRKRHNDIVIDNLAVSGEHGEIMTVHNDSFLVDLDSTNGILVNGMAIQKHFLRNNDVVEIGKYKLKYLNDQQSKVTATDFEKTMVLNLPPRPVTRPAIPDPTHEATGKLKAMVPAQSALGTQKPVAPQPKVPIVV